MPIKMNTTVKIFTDAKSGKKAFVVLSKIKSKIHSHSLSEKCEPYHKGGYVCSIEIRLPSSSWEEIPYNLLSLCQNIGSAWKISGNIEEEFDAWSNESNVQGVNSVHVQCLRQA